MNRAIIIILCVCVAFNLSGCLGRSAMQDTRENQDERAGEEEEQMIQLTERQISILQASGMSTEVEELGSEQLSAIIAMEELFEYLEERYEEKFEYVGYIAETPLDKEELIVQVLDGTSLERISVYRENGIITDDYINLLVKEPYQELTNSFFEQHESGIESKTFSEIYSVEGEINTQNLFSIVRASSATFVPESMIQIEDLNELSSQFAEWYVSQVDGMGVVNTIIILEDCDYEEINQFARYDYKEKEIARARIHIDRQGGIEISVK